MYTTTIKPLISIFSGIVLLALFLPLVLVTTILLAFANKGSIFFTQRRPGKGGKIFSIVKFKTMTDERGDDGELLPDEKRLTKVGQTVRKLSLDELPQLLNVIKGDMSLVGPRPLLPQYLPLYNEEQARRHEVKPGITGWAQVNGRNAISWEDKFKFDVWYVDNITFVLDIKIIISTFVNVMKRSDISSDTSATMEPFTGSEL